MFGILGGKKQGSSPQRRVPTERVSSLASRGVPEPEIIRILKDEGFTPMEVDKAMTNALRSAVGGQPRRPDPMSMRREPGLDEEPLADMPSDYPEPLGYERPQQDRRRPLPPEPSPMDGAPDPVDLPPERDFQPSRGQRRQQRYEEDDDFGAPPQARMPSPPEAEDMRDLPPPRREEEMMRGPFDMPDIPGKPEWNRRAADYPQRRGYEEGYEEPQQSRQEPQQYRQEPQQSRQPRMPQEEEPIQRLPVRRTQDEKKDDRRRAIEELAEGIIEEKWNSLQASLIEFENKMTLIENKMDLFETAIKRLEGDKKQDMNQIEDKIDTYRSAITEMSGRVESVESAMRNTMTPLMQSMRELSDTIKTMKKSQ